MSEFFKLYRKKGVYETIDTLYNSRKKQIKQAEFFTKIKERFGYLNSFFKVRKELIHNDIIKYKLDEDYEKIIYLTEKGRELYKLILEIDSIITNKIESQDSTETKLENKEEISKNEINS